jgi:hypothetical protein
LLQSYWERELAVVPQVVEIQVKLERFDQRTLRGPVVACQRSTSSLGTFLGRRIVKLALGGSRNGPATLVGEVLEVQSLQGLCLRQMAGGCRGSPHTKSSFVDISLGDDGA